MTDCFVAGTRNSIRVPALAFVAVSVLMSACSSSEGEVASDGFVAGEDYVERLDVDSADAAGSLDALILPVDDVRDVNNEFDRAADKHVETCMTEQGFEYQRPDDFVATEEEPVSDSAAESDIESEADLESYSLALYGSEEDNTQMTLDPELPAAVEIEAGIADGGCVGEAATKLVSREDFLKLQSFLLEFEGWPFLVNDIVVSAEAFEDMFQELLDCGLNQGLALEEVPHIQGVDEIKSLALPEPDEKVLVGCAESLDYDAGIDSIREAAAKVILEDVQGRIAAWEEVRPVYLQSIEEHSS